MYILAHARKCINKSAAKQYMMAAMASLQTQSLEPFDFEKTDGWAYAYTVWQETFSC